MAYHSVVTAQYSILRIAQSTLHFTSLTKLFNQTPSQLLWEASIHMQQLKCESCSYTYQPLSIARYSFIQLSELKRCGVKKLAQGLTQHRIRIRVLLVESLKLFTPVECRVFTVVQGEWTRWTQCSTTLPPPATAPTPLRASSHCLWRMCWPT